MILVSLSLYQIGIISFYYDRTNAIWASTVHMISKRHQAFKKSFLLRLLKKFPSLKTCIESSVSYNFK